MTKPRLALSLISHAAVPDRIVLKVAAAGKSSRAFPDAPGKVVKVVDPEKR
ncbi:MULTISPECIES: hypothetical protein [Dyella]|uniref:hypothetical protein n=1 Tax=Dyella TaxID=231454 RepID=UPI0013F14DA8|nr:MULTISPECIES: hypothetical protein [Dyella]